MKTIAVNSTKGGTGKSTLSILLLNALTGAGYKCLAIDTDMINHSLSFYYNSGILPEEIFKKNVFKVFSGEEIKANTFTINDNLDLLHADVRLTDYRATESFKKLKKAMEGLKYDFTIIDTAPTFDNITVNVFSASDILLVPINLDIFNYQSVQYLFDKLEEIGLSELDVNIIFNQYEKPKTDNKETVSNQIIDIFKDDKRLKGYICPYYISKSNIIKKYINDWSYRISARKETKKQYEEITSLIQKITDTTIEGDI
ncbi:chromosome partitioning protein ParA [Spirochaetia bacterium]|nr:chromosome partitioning protein ParA [Spirochaetia bacterium]